MRLRDRLLVLSTAQLLVFGTVFALAYGAFERTVLPMFEDMLGSKSERVSRMIRSDLDTAILADDRDQIARELAVLFSDPDLAYIAVRNARDETIYGRGEPPPIALYADAPYAASVAGGYVRAWAPVTRNDRPLGAVVIVYSMARIDALAVWAQRVAIIVALMWVAAFAYSLGLASSLVSPIRAMMDFSRKVAGGALSERLVISAPGELRDLRDYLNQMTADLERREAERKVATTRAEAMQSELLSMSRLAGMAEIATGVLHNVGNVLNSLNVSVTVISDQVRSSRIAGLTRSIEQVDAFPGGLPAFLETEKGKVLPTYLTSVSKRLSEENAKVLEELGSINRHVDHIKTIVAMQQTYARPSGVLEHVVLGDLIDDALHLGEASFAKHGIEVVKHYDDVTLMTDRHKLLQIMINLISNARHALEEHRATTSGAVALKLTVRLRSTPRSLTIDVIDTGVGIPEANLVKIFRHGFTTKPGGHGFGLHASANAARELGGTLQAASPGPGRGATFTLELPSAIPEAHHDLRN